MLSDYRFDHTEGGEVCVLRSFFYGERTLALFSATGNFFGKLGADLLPEIGSGVSRGEFVVAADCDTFAVYFQAKIGHSLSVAITVIAWRWLGITFIRIGTS